MSNLLNPFASPFSAFPAVDTFSILGIPLPGRWTLQKATRRWDWAYLVPLGYAGAIFTSVSGPPMQIDFRGEFWNPIDWATYKQIDALILKQPAKTLGNVGGVLPSLAMGLKHPELQRLGVNSVVLLEKEPLIQSDRGLWTIHLRFLEWTRALQLAAAPKTAIPDTGPAFGPPAPTAFNIESTKLTNSIDKSKAALGR